MRRSAASLLLVLVTSCAPTTERIVSYERSRSFDDSTSSPNSSSKDSIDAVIAGADKALDTLDQRAKQVERSRISTAKQESYHIKLNTCIDEYSQFAAKTSFTWSDVQRMFELSAELKALETYRKQYSLRDQSNPYRSPAILYGAVRSIIIKVQGGAAELYVSNLVKDNDKWWRNQPDGFGKSAAWESSKRQARFLGYHQLSLDCGNAASQTVILSGEVFIIQDSYFYILATQYAQARDRSR